MANEPIIEAARAIQAVLADAHPAPLTLQDVQRRLDFEIGSNVLYAIIDEHLPPVGKVHHVSRELGIAVTLLYVGERTSSDVVRAWYEAMEDKS